MRLAAALLPPLLAALAVVVPEAVGSPRQQTPEATPLAARLTACDVGPNAADRSAGFEGTMPAASDADTLGMRFNLQVKRGPAGFKALPAPTFGRWLTSEPGAAGFVYDKRVESLQAGASYRVVVSFRWKDADGKVVKTARKTTSLCRQPDLRPDLGVTAVDVAPAAAAGRSTYTVTVENTGKGPAGVPFGVTLKAGRAAPLTQTLPSLDAGASAPLVFEAPTCAAGSMLRATVDPAGVVPEVREAGDNLLTLPCPSGR